MDRKQLPAALDALKGTRAGATFGCQPSDALGSSATSGARTERAAREIDEFRGPGVRETVLRRPR